VLQTITLRYFIVLFLRFTVNFAKILLIARNLFVDMTV
jgi:hypothetical protein